MPTFRHIRRSIAALLLVMHLPACSAYVVPKGITPQEYIAVNHPKRVRVTLIDRSQHYLRDPWVTSDSLGGVLPARDSRGFRIEPPPAPWVVALSAVRRVEVYQSSGSATVGAVLGGTLILAMSAVLITYAAWPRTP